METFGSAFGSAIQTIDEALNPSGYCRAVSPNGVYEWLKPDNGLTLFVRVLVKPSPAHGSIEHEVEVIGGAVSNSESTQVSFYSNADFNPMNSKEREELLKDGVINARSYTNYLQAKNKTH